ncbi:hypothetical protein DL770_003214 [Monosporascus sp. CRB-9-2]|nr:hypothetical protein DL770_003214 [Monosporascus sp. CRB-9-2]
MDNPRKNAGPSHAQSPNAARGRLTRALRKVASTPNILPEGSAAPDYYRPLPELPIHRPLPDLPHHRPLQGLAQHHTLPDLQSTAQGPHRLRKFASNVNLHYRLPTAQGTQPLRRFASNFNLRRKHDNTAAHPHADLMSPSPIIPPRGSSQSNSSSLPTTMTGSLRFLQRLSSSGNAASQLDGRPSTQDTTTLVPSVQQSLFSFATAHSQQETPQFGTTTTITGPSGRATTRENPLKRLMNWFQRDHGDDVDDDSSSDSGLDPEMTCRGLPGIHYFEEVKVTSSPADPSSSNPQAQEDTISHFKTEKHILPNKKTLDENDESLQRYKQSLGLGGGKDLSDPNDPRVCIIQSLTMESPGRDPVTIDLSKPGSEQTLKDKPFKIKEGSKFTMVATFKVQHEILSGLQYVQVVKRKGLKVGKDSEMLGSYAPNTDKQPLYTKRFQEEDAPSGMLARGHYNAVSSFVDDDKKTHLQFEWSFDISKDW